MKKIFVLAIAICVMVGTLIPYKLVKAETHSVVAKSNGSVCDNGITFTPKDITVKAGDTITFSIQKDDPYLTDLKIHEFPGGDITVLPGQDGSHITPALLVDVPLYTATTSNGCKKGNGTVKIENAPPEPAPPPPPAPLPVTIPIVAANPPPANKEPDPLKIDEIIINDEKYDIKKKISVDMSQSFSISGYTIADGVVNLTIHSITRNEIVRANANGLWKYEVKNLEPGDHYIEATVTNLASKLTSKNVTILKFSITGKSETKEPPVLTANITPSDDKHNKSGPIVASTSLIVVLLLAGFYWFKKLPKKAQEPIVTESPPPTEINPSV